MIDSGEWEDRHPFLAWLLTTLIGTFVLGAIAGGIAGDGRTGALVGFSITQLVFFITNAIRVASVRIAAAVRESKPG